MARDEGLEELLRDRLASEPGLTEKPMFGGRAWLLDGALLCGARDDGMLVRLGPDRDGWARAGPAAFGDDALRGRLIDAALRFVRSLPAK